jgi:hypothetical protein
MSTTAHSQTWPQGSDDCLESTEVTTLLLNEPSPLASACCVAPELHDRIANWVNEGGAGGEVNR